jgi:hypothetical protein
MRRKTWRVVLAGKWGGTRTIDVQATTAERARAQAVSQAYIHERVMQVAPVTDRETN